MAGSVYRSQINPLVLQKRSEPCYPFWIPSGPCVGDGNYATQNVTQTNCPSLPGNSVTDCADQMPFTCSINTISLDSSVFTCGDCSSVPEGQYCYFVCSDPAATFTDLSLRSLLCLQTGFQNISSVRAPKCLVAAQSCPPILSWNGMSTDYASVCVGAREGNVCRASCQPGYYSANGWYDTTCTAQFTWSRELTCNCQVCGEFGDPQCATNANTNPFDYKYI